MNKLSSCSAGQGMTKVVDKVNNLNDSDDDFKSVIVTKVQPAKLKTQDHNDQSNPPCPFCSKSFAAGSNNRASHLKACASQLGVDTRQLLEIKKLEQRQADEWKALNLPSKTAAANNITKSRCSKTEPSRK